MHFQLKCIYACCSEGNADAFFTYHACLRLKRLKKLTSPLVLPLNLFLLNQNQLDCLVDISSRHMSGTTKNVICQMISSQGISSQDVSSQDVSSQDVSSQDVSSQDVSSQDVSSQDVSSQDISSQDVCSQDTSIQDISGQDVSGTDASGPVPFS